MIVAEELGGRDRACCAVAMNSSAMLYAALEYAFRRNELAREHESPARRPGCQEAQRSIRCSAIWKSERGIGRPTRRSSRPRAVRWSGAEAPRALHLHVSVPQAREGTRSAERKNVRPIRLQSDDADTSSTSYVQRRADRKAGLSCARHSQRYRRDRVR